MKTYVYHILAEHRNWNDEYAEAEWQWYLSGNPNVDKLGDIYGKVLKYGNEWLTVIMR
jgi:hypothetical protein